VQKRPEFKVRIAGRGEESEEEKEEGRRSKAENVSKAHIVALYNTRCSNNERLRLHLHICRKVF
jgi:hypothetical protein